MLIFVLYAHIEIGLEDHEIDLSMHCMHKLVNCRCTSLLSGKIQLNSYLVILIYLDIGTFGVGKAPAGLE